MFQSPIRGATAAALLLAVSAPAFGSSEDQVPDWMQTPDAVTLIGDGYLGPAVRPH